MYSSSVQKSSVDRITLCYAKLNVFCCEECIMILTCGNITVLSSCPAGWSEGQCYCKRLLFSRRTQCSFVSTDLRAIWSLCLRSSIGSGGPVKMQPNTPTPARPESRGDSSERSSKWSWDQHGHTAEREPVGEVQPKGSAWHRNKEQVLHGETKAGQFLYTPKSWRSDVPLCKCYMHRAPWHWSLKISFTCDQDEQYTGRHDQYICHCDTYLVVWLKYSVLV